MPVGTSDTEWAAMGFAVSWTGRCLEGVSTYCGAMLQVCWVREGTTWCVLCRCCAYVYV
jgi:hypothetical protein